MPHKAHPLQDAAAPIMFERRAGRLRRRSDVIEARKRAFLRLASHELRTPLNAIVGFSEILAGELYGPLGAPQYREYAEHVRSSGYRLLRLINQMIDLARLDAGGERVEVEPQAIGEALSEAAASLRADAVFAEIAVGLDIEGEPLALADARGLRVALVNLLQTAAVRTPPGGRIEVSARRVMSRIEIRIEDAGEPVPEEALAHLLDPFDGADDGFASLDGEGLGLGLAIARLQCIAMGGGLRLLTREAGGLMALAHLPAA